MPESDLVNFDHFSEPRSGSTPAEVYRAVFPGRTPEGQLNTVIVTRQGSGTAGRVWLTFWGAIRTTVAMTDGEAGELIELLDKATRRKVGDEIVQVGDLAPGNKFSLEFRLGFDGTRYPLQLILNVGAAGGTARQLVVDVPERGRPSVTERRCPDRRSPTSGEGSCPVKSEGGSVDGRTVAEIIDRNTQALPTSVGRPRRPSGGACRNRATPSGQSRSRHSRQIRPGETPLTRMPYRPYSNAAVRVKWITAAFDAQ